MAAWLGGARQNNSRCRQSNSASKCRSSSLKQSFLEQLLAQPDRHCHAEGAEALRAIREIGLEQALELQERLVVEDDVINVAEIDPASLRQYRSALLGKFASNFLRVNRSSCAAATTRPSSTSAAALSW